MVALSQILSPSHIHLEVSGSSKKKVLQNIAEIISNYAPELTADSVFDHLIAREKLGSTGFGDGVAIPHCRIALCQNVTGAFFRLSTPIEFDAVDRKPVDLVFVLLVPEEKNQDHLALLSQLAEKLSHQEIRQQLRHSKNPEDIHRLLSE